MTMASALYAALVADPGVNALIGTRAYPVILPHGVALPALRYQRVSNSETVGRAVVRETRYQFDCWGSTYASAVTLAGAVKALWENWRGDPLVKYARVANELDDYDPETDTVRVIVDVLFITIGD